LVADFEGLVRDFGGFAHCVAGWVAVPVVVWFCHVADVVELLGWIVDVDVNRCVADGAADGIAAVFNAPEPFNIMLACVHFLRCQD